MADRPNMTGYPMPSGFPMGMGQQQQQQPMMQQQMQPNPNPMQASANFTEQRMWQLQRMQMENQRRAQIGAVDGMNPQMNPQMAELLRSQAAAAALMQNQGQHNPMQQPQMQQPPQGQQFPNVGQLGQMNAMNMGKPNQPHQGIGQLQQGPTQSGAAGVNQGGLNAAMMARVNPAILSSYFQNNRMNRQMNLLNTARNQQPQNGPVNFNPQTTPFNNQFGQGPLQPELRAPTQAQPQAMSVKPPEIQLQIMQQQQRQAAQFMHEFLRTKDGRLLTNDEIRMKAIHFKRDIDADKVQLQQLSTNVTPDTVQAIKMKQDAIRQKEFLFLRLQQLVQTRLNAGAQQMMDGQGGGPSNMHMQPNVSGQQTMSPNSGWVASDRGGGNPPGPISTPNLANAQPNGNIPPSHPQMSTSPFHRQQTTPVPRMGPTPQQQPPQSMDALLRQNNQPSPQRGPTPAATPQNRPQAFDHTEGPRSGSVMGSMPVLDRFKFEELIKQWWQQNNIAVDERMLILGERRIDLYELYVEVTRLGGAVAVNRHDLWAVVAAKLGWIVTPAQGAEPARSAPQAANQMKVVYERYVAALEQQISSHNLREVMSGLNSNPQPAENAPGPSAPAPPLIQYVKFAPISAEMLRKNGMPEAMVQYIEQNRAALQGMYRQMQRIQGSNLTANANGPNIPAQTQMQPMHPNGQAINGSNQVINPPFIAPGPGAASGQNGFGSIQHSQPTGQINQQKWSEVTNAIIRLKEEVARERSNQPMLPKNVSDAEKTQINNFFEGFVRLATDIDKILPMYYYLHNDYSFVKNLVSIVDIVVRQRNLLQPPNPVYILDLNNLKRLYYISNQARERFQELVQRQKQMEHGRAVNGGQGPPGEGGLPMLGGHQQVHPGMQGQMLGAIPGVPRPPSRQPQPPAVMHAPPANRPVMMPPQRPPSVSQGKSKAAENAHSPAPPVSTPGPSASTPTTLASPQTPKSPKAPKAPAKPKPQKQRRASKAAPPTPTIPLATAASQGSSAGENPLKRPREDEPSSSSVKAETSNDAGHVAKRIKGEWEETTLPEASKAQKEVDNNKTPDAAAQLYKDMMDMLNNGDPNSHGLDNDIVETLASVAASYIPQQGADLLLGSSEVKGSSSPKLGPSGVDELFSEFLDFTSFTQDDEKVDTPELLPSSSTNPSPESNAEPETHPPSTSDAAKAVDVKAEPFPEFEDPTRIGFWADIDGGESSYFTDHSWKWDGTSSTEPSWAIST